MRSAKWRASPGQSSSQLRPMATAVLSAFFWVVRQKPLCGRRLARWLVVREKQDRSTNQRARKSALQFRKILVPLDFSEPSRLGLEYALGFEQEFHATVVL